MFMIKTDNIQEISMQGFQVVSGGYFAHLPRKHESACTLWHTSIAFNQASLTALNECEHIRIEVNTDKKCLLAIPVTMADKDSIRWTKGVKEKKTRKMECKSFTSNLYKLWDFDPRCGYRAKGKIVSCDKKIMLMFDFSDSERWYLRDTARG